MILQKRVIRIMNNSDFSAHTNPIFKVFHFLKFQDTKSLQISQFMFSICNNTLPLEFQDMFTLNNQIHSYNTRSSKRFHVSCTRTKLLYIYIVFFISINTVLIVKSYLMTNKLLY